MIDKERDARMIGYGAMLMEGLVGIVALIAACALHPGDYFAINIPPDDLRQARHVDREPAPSFAALVGETLVGRTGGAVSLAVGIRADLLRHPGFSRR